MGVDIMRIFIAFPFTAHIRKNGLLPDDYVKKLIMLKKKIENMGHTVILAHEREE